MAVEKAKVVARIKALFPKLNLSQKRLDEISDRLAQKPADDADDAAIDTVINDLNDVLPLANIAKEDDRVRNLEIKMKAKGKKKTETQTETDEEEEEETEIDANTPAWAKALIKQNQQLAQKVTQLETGKQTETKLSLAKKAFESSDVLKGIKSEEVKQRWINRFDLESEASFEDQVKDFESEYTELVQANADGTPLGGPAGGGSNPSTVNQKEVDEVVDSMKI